MGAGVSIANNTAQAVASAYESVINTTNVVTQQDNTQEQSVILNACDINAKGDVTIDEGAVLTQAMTQIASISSSTSVTNDIAQALSQAAAASVGAGVLGIASASNQASTYANMSTNISNYVSLSAIQATKQKQVFSCNNSTIVAGGNVSISLLSTDQSNQYTDYTVENSTNIADTITQTISQTATASTGFSIGGLVLILVIACIGLLIYKLAGAKSTASHAQQIQEAVSAGCLDASHLESNGTVMPTMSPGSACAGLDVDKLLHPHKYVKPVLFGLYFFFILALGITLGMWYLGVSQRGCLFNDACGPNQDSQNYAGCSCNYDAATDGVALSCEDPQMSSFTSTGMPLKYQYPVFYSDTNGLAYAPCTGGTTALQSPASMQGILVSALKGSSPIYNSNNGKNMDTLMKYVSMVGWPSTTVLDYKSVLPTFASGQNKQVLDLFQAGVDYLATQTDNVVLAALYEAITNETKDPTGRAQLLALYVCPLRIVGITNDSTTSTALDSAWPGITKASKASTDATCLGATDNWVTETTFASNPSTYLVNVPQAFATMPPPSSSSNDNPNPCYTDQGNVCAGCCSAYMVKFVATTAAGSSTYTNSCGSDGKNESACFCNGFTSSDPSCSQAKGKVGQGPNADAYGQLKMQLPTSTTDPNKVTTMFLPNFQSADANTYLPFYVEWADFGAVADEDGTSDTFTSFVRLLWAGVLAYLGKASNTTVYGINALANHATDHYYVAYSPGKSYGRIGDSNSDPAILANDVTLLTIKVVGHSSYDPRFGMPPMPCSGIGQANSGQSYTASAPEMGYCRNWFYNKAARIIVIVLLILCVLWLPFYYLARLYIDRNVGNMYLREALDASSKTTSTTSSSSSSNSTSTTSLGKDESVVVGQKVEANNTLKGGYRLRKRKKHASRVQNKRIKHVTRW
jgi:hypothetical protein